MDLSLTSDKSCSCLHKHAIALSRCYANRSCCHTIPLRRRLTNSSQIWIGNLLLELEEFTHAAKLYPITATRNSISIVVCPPPQCSPLANTTCLRSVLRIVDGISQSSDRLLLSRSDSIADAKDRSSKDNMGSAVIMRPFQRLH